MVDVITNKAEEELKEALKKCWLAFPTHRCLQLKFSQYPPQQEDWLDEVLHVLRRYVDEKSSQIFVCHDNDIFVLNRYLTHKRVSELLAHLAHKLPPAFPPGLADLFEIGVHWARLERICDKKIENMALMRMQRPWHEKESLSKVSRNQVMKTIDVGLIDTLAQRRENRQAPEVMIVEDDPFSQRLVRNVLQDKYAHCVSGDGQGALLNYVNRAPDILFLDIGLPDINGHEVLERLFAFDPDAYVVMFSGNGDKDNIIRAVELGAKGFVGKPFTQEKIFQYIEKSPFVQAKKKKESIHGNSVC